MITVNGLALPEKLEALLLAGRWPPARGKADASGLPIDDGDLLMFFDVAAMEANTQDLLDAVARGESWLFWLIDGGPAKPGFLDVSQAVMIASTYGQESLVLDYSGGGEPRVLCTDYDAKGWVEVARSFNELLPLLALEL
jgi:hypothetical protein